MKKLVFIVASAICLVGILYVANDFSFENPTIETTLLSDSDTQSKVELNEMAVDSKSNTIPSEDISPVEPSKPVITATEVVKVEDNKKTSDALVPTPAPLPKIVSTEKEVPATTTKIDDTKVDSTSNTSKPLNCDDDWQCLISASASCKYASGVVSYKNISQSWFPIPGLLFSGKTRYEIKKSGSDCSLIYSYLNISVDLSPEQRLEELKNGLSEDEIDDQLKTMNSNIEKSYNITNTCLATGDIIAAFIKDQKTGEDAGYAVSVSTNTKDSIATQKTVVTTSTGKKITCTSQNPIEI
jgi:hypothetical protein